jgi:hypothetical protein
MANIKKGSSLPTTAYQTDFHNLVDTATIVDIVNADISVSANIADTKLDTISTAGKVNASALQALSNIPSGAGVIPVVNVPTSATVGTAASTGAGTVKMGSANPANNTGWLTVLIGATTVYVPYWTDETP